MSAARILVIDGHPDPSPARFGHALAEAYAASAKKAGHGVRVVRLHQMQCLPLESAADFALRPTDGRVLDARADLEWADHAAILFPLWLGGMPARLHAFFEHVARGGFVAQLDSGGWRPRLKGKSARLIVTMGMPSLAYRLIFGAHGVESLKHSILGFAGMGPIRTTLFGAIEATGAAGRARMLERVRMLGARGG